MFKKILGDALQGAKDIKNMFTKSEAQKEFEAKRLEIDLKNPHSKAFKKAWGKAYYNKEYNRIPIPDDLLSVYLLSKKEKEDREYGEDCVTIPEPEKAYKAKKNIQNHDNHNVSTSNEGVKHIQAPKKERKIVLQNISNRDIERVKWAIREVGKLNFAESVEIKNGARSSYITVKLDADSIRKASGSTTMSAIQKSLGGDKVRAKVFLESGGKLVIVLTKAEFSPIYTESNLALLKNEGDFILGEIKGEIRVLNIKKMSQAHLGVVGGSESGKSFFLNNVIQSLIYSSPSAEFYLFSPKTDDKGGDFSKFAKYPQVKVCEIIGENADAQLNILLSLRKVLETQLDNIHSQKSVPLQIIAIDELVYLLELKSKPSKPKKPSDDDEDWEWERYEKKMNRYKIDLIKEDLVELLEDFAKLGRKIGRLIVGTQLLNKTVMSNQFMQNVEQISFKVSNGNGSMSGFNSLAEDLLPRGDGLATDPSTNEVINFQGLLATP